MASDKLNELYQRYRAARGTDVVSLAEFERVLMMFPALLVLNADGHIDSTEMMFISQLSRFMADPKANINEADIRQEVRYLSRSLAQWRKEFIEVLRDYIRQHNLATEVLDIMISAAASSTGNVRQNVMIKLRAIDPSKPDADDAFVSEDEKEAILTLVGELEMNTHPAVIQRLQEILG